MSLTQIISKKKKKMEMGRTPVRSFYEASILQVPTLDKGV